jgi:hypothetical protein
MELCKLDNQSDSLIRELAQALQEERRIGVVDETLSNTKTATYHYLKDLQFRAYCSRKEIYRAGLFKLLLAVFKVIRKIDIEKVSENEKVVKLAQ